MKISKGGITRNIDEKRFPEYAAKGYKQAKDTKGKGTKDEAKDTKGKE